MTKFATQVVCDLLIVVAIVSAVSCAQPYAAVEPTTVVTEARKGKAFELRLLDFKYLGAFRVPFGQIGSSSFSYGGTALAFNPHRTSLFLVGHDHHQAIAEVEIPAIINSTATEDLKTAKVLQPFVNIKSRIPNWTLEGNTKIGGLIVVGDQLIGTVYEFYDADGNAQDSHFGLSSLNLQKADVGGLFRAGKLGGGYVAGYMAEIPLDWQNELGVKHLTGQAALSIISRTSAGPAAFGFDPAQLGQTVAAASPLVYYPLANTLAREGTHNEYFNTTTEITGLVFPQGTDQVWFFGSHGTGPWWYGSNGEVPGRDDPYRTSKGPHAAPYVYQAWVYNAHDLFAAKQGKMQPWDARPQEVLTFELPFPEGSKRIGGVAYDSKARRLFVSQLLADKVRYDMNPVIHVFQLAPRAGTEREESDR